MCQLSSRHMCERRSKRSSNESDPDRKRFFQSLSSGYARGCDHKSGWRAIFPPSLFIFSWMQSLILRWSWHCACLTRICFFSLHVSNLFIDHVERNAILQVFVYDNSPHKMCGIFSFVFVFRFSPHSKSEFIGKMCALTSQKRHGWWLTRILRVNGVFRLDVCTSLRHRRSFFFYNISFYWVKFSELMTSWWNLWSGVDEEGKWRRYARTTRLDSRKILLDDHKAVLALKIHNENTKRDDLLVFRRFHGIFACFIALLAKLLHNNSVISSVRSRNRSFFSCSPSLTSALIIVENDD